MMCVCLNCLSHQLFFFYNNLHLLRSSVNFCGTKISYLSTLVMWVQRGLYLSLSYLSILSLCVCVCPFLLFLSLSLFFLKSFQIFLLSFILFVFHHPFFFCFFILCLITFAIKNILAGCRSSVVQC